MVLELGRFGIIGTVSYTLSYVLSCPVHTVTQAAFSQPVLEPVVGDPRWGGLEVVTALVQTPGHWINYTKVAGVWWCQDSAGPPGAFLADPFLAQSANNTIQELGFRV